MTRGQRFWAKVRFTSSCWLWTGARTTAGYGHFQYGRRGEPLIYAHRFAYERLVGPIPAGLQLDHLCRVRNCVNPAHLEPVTNAENARRARPSACRRAGHPYPENAYVRPDGRGVQCKACQRVRARLAYQKRRRA